MMCGASVLSTFLAAPFMGYREVCSLSRLRGGASSTPCDLTRHSAGLPRLVDGVRRQPVPPPLRKIVVSTQNTMRAYPMQKARAFARASINRSSPDIPQDDYFMKTQVRHRSSSAFTEGRKTPRQPFLPPQKTAGIRPAAPKASYLSSSCGARAASPCIPAAYPSCNRTSRGRSPESDHGLQDAFC